MSGYLWRVVIHCSSANARNRLAHSSWRTTYGCPRSSYGPGLETRLAGSCAGADRCAGCDTPRCGIALWGYTDRSGGVHLCFFTSFACRGVGELVACPPRGQGGPDGRLKGRVIKESCKNVL